MFDNHFTTNFAENALVKKVWKSVNIWQRYGQNFVAYFLGHPVYKTNEVFLDVQKFAADIDCQGHSSLKVIGYLLAFTRNAWLAITPSEMRF